MKSAINQLNIDNIEKFVTQGIHVMSKQPNADPGSIVSSVLMQMMPALLEIVSNLTDKIISNAADKMCEKLNEQNAVTVGKVKNEVQKQEWKLDALEQYTRKESVKIIGVETQENENTTDIVFDITNSIGVTITSDDIICKPQVAF